MTGMNDIRDVEVSGLTMQQPPENRLDFEPYDIYRKLTRKEKQAMQKKIQEDTVKFASGLDERVLPQMPNTKKSSVLAKRRFLGIIAERQARLQAQIDWLRREQEKNRKQEEA